MATKKKLLQAAAGTAAAGGGGLNVEDVFSTYLYTGNDTSTAIDNGVDLAGEGGLVWVKARSTTVEHVLYDTERGALKLLQSQSTAAELTQSTGLSSFNSNGFTVGTNGNINGSPHEYASWTFRKAPKFFDVVTYTGNGTNGREISHNLQGEIGFIAIKRTDATDEWAGAARKSNGVYSVWITDPSYALFQTDAALYDDTGNVSGNNVPSYTDTYFTVGASFTGATNTSGATYVAYLFAHNDGDGEFGPDGDADIIKCGSYTGNSTIGHTIDLGFEAQWVLVRSTSNLRKWMLYDAMRGMPVDGNGAALYPNSTDDEEALQRIGSSNVGFQLTSTDSMVNLSGETYIYIAIRRGPMAVPESATDVFDVNAITGNGTSDRAINTGFVTDVHLSMRRSSNYPTIVDRLRGHGSGRTKRLATHVTNAEQSLTGNYWLGLDTNDGYILSSDYENQSSQTYVQYAWKRAPSHFDVVAYTGNGTAGRTVSHNLGVAPEMIWVKRRNANSNWSVYHSAIGNDKYIVINSTNTPVTSSTFWNNTDPTASSYTVGTANGTNNTNDTYIAYLFASLDGVSKVGSFTHSGGNTNVDCGFSSGARFVLIKKSSDTSGWYVWDSERGIVAGNDPYLLLNSTAAEFSVDTIDPYSSGFTITDVQGSGTYIFYAIA